MPTTKIPRERLEAYFDGFTKRFLLGESTVAADVDVLTPELGDQVDVQGAHLIGITYEPKGNVFDLAFDSGDHRIYRPSEVWAVEDSDGFVSSIEISQDDGAKEVVRVHRAGGPARAD